MKGLLILAALIAFTGFLYQFVVIPIVLCSPAMMKKYNGLPEWSRWVLCWPCSIAVVAFCWIALVLLTWWFLPMVLMQIVAPPFGHGVFVLSIYAMVPRGRRVVVLTFMVLRLLCSVVFIGIGLAALSGAAEIDSDFWPQMCGEIAVLLVSVVLWKQIRPGQDQSVLAEEEEEVCALRR